MKLQNARPEKYKVCIKIIGSLIISNDDDSSKNAAKKMNLMLSLSSSLWLLMLTNRLLQYSNLEASLKSLFLKSTCSQTILSCAWQPTRRIAVPNCRPIWITFRCDFWTHCFRIDLPTNELLTVTDVFFYHPSKKILFLRVCCIF